MSKTLRQPSLRIGYLKRSEERALEFGAVGLQPRAQFHIDIGPGLPPVPLDFVVDSGASMTIIGLEYAANHDLPVPPPHVETTLNLLAASGAAPVRVRPGRIRLWWTADRAGYPFDWPVLFRPGLPLTVPPILGLGGVIGTCEWLFGGRYQPDTPFGALTLDDIR